MICSAPTVLDPKTDVAGNAVLRRQVHVFVRSGTEVEDPRPVGHGIQIDPGRYGDRVSAGNNASRQCNILIRSAQVHCVAFLPATQVAPPVNVPFQPLPDTSFAVVPLVSLNGSSATGNTDCPFMTCVTSEAVRARL